MPNRTGEFGCPQAVVRPRDCVCSGERTGFDAIQFTQPS